MYKKSLSFLLFSLLSSLAVHAGGHHESHDHPGHAHRTHSPQKTETKHVGQALLPQGFGEEAPALTAEFSIRRKDSRGRWSTPTALRFTRTDDKVILEYSDLTEVWKRSADGTCEFERIFNEDKRVVEYVSGQLRSLGVFPDWATLRVALDESALQQLQQARGAGNSSFGKVLSYHAKGRGQSISFDWSARHQLPVKLVRRYPDASATEMKLISVGTDAKSHSDAISARSESLLRIDAADIGDMEYDPFVKKVIRLDTSRGWLAGHAH